MRHVILKAVSTQLCSAIERVNSGSPTCMATTHLIAVGTQNGFILVFDSCQVIKWFLGGLEIGSNYGAVSSLAFNSDSSKLLAGFARGPLMEWDLNSGKILRDMPDLHPPGSAVLTTKYSDDQNFAFFADSGGSVFEVNMKRGLRGPGASARCIFSGSRGEVCTMEPLRVGAYPGHPLAEHSILALATISKVIVITVRPRLKVLMTSSLTGSPQTLPLLCWQFVVIQNPSYNKVVDPVLTFARESTIHFYQVTVNLSDKIVFIPLQSIKLNFILLSLQWLNTRCMGLIDSQEQFHLLDVRTRDRLETVDLSGVKLVYQTQFFKAAATGGNVSAALGLAGEMAAYGSCTSFTNQLLILGNRTYHVLMIRSWAERLEHLLKNNRYIAAMQLGAEFYQDPGRGLVGLRGTRDRKRNLVSLKMVGILKKFLDISMTKNFPAEGGMGTLTKYFNEIVPPCVSLCVRLGKVDLLFDCVWTTFQEDPFSSAVYLESLEPYILSDQLVEIPPAIVQEFVSHYHKRGKLEGLEACVTHLCVTCLDIHQVMSLCQEHQLYDAIIHIYNSAMMDYITPTEKLLALLGSAMAREDPLTDVEIKLGNKLLVYISCCLAGRAYPWGDIPKERVKQVKYDVYSTITTTHSRHINTGTETDEVLYPYLHILLQFDTQGFLNVISLAFEEEEFSGEVGHCQKQRLVDILLELMVKHQSPFSASQVGFLFTFLARQLARGDGAPLVVSRTLFLAVLGVLTQEDGDGREERQQALLDMIAAGGWDNFDLEVLEESCEKVGFYKILEKLYEKEGKMERILDCYLKDNSRILHIFSFLQKILTDESQTSETKETIRTQFESNIERCVVLDARQTALLLYSHMRDRLAVCVETLHGRTRYSLLSALIDCMENASGPSTPVHEPAPDYLSSPDIYKDYIGLMLELEPAQVASYLRARPDCCPGDNILELARKHGVTEVQVLLLERDGRVGEAFSLLKEGLEEQIKTVIEHTEETNPVQWTSLNTALIVAVTFCQRVSPTLSTVQEREDLWCPLLSTVTSPQAGISSPVLVDKWRELVRHVVSSMLGHVSHQIVVQAVLADPGSSHTSNWAELRRLLAEIIDTFRYESQLLESSKEVVQEERAGLVRSLVLRRNQGLPCVSCTCSICGLDLSVKNGTGGGGAVITVCRHSYHGTCLDRAGGLGLSPVGEEVWSCTLCQPTGKSGKKTQTKLEKDVESVSEEVNRARNYLKLYEHSEQSSHIFEEISYIKSDKFYLRLQPGAPAIN